MKKQQELGTIRPKIKYSKAEKVLQKLQEKLDKRLSKRGSGSFASRHEILGILAEEHHELLEAVWKGSTKEIKSELYDYAVGAVWAIACINSGTIK